MGEQALPKMGEAMSDGLAALRVGHGERALVSGTGPIAQLAADALERLTGFPPSRVIPGPAEGTPGGREAPEVDVLVDTSGDAGWWVSVMSRVRRQGRVLLLLPPGERVIAFDFYDRVHRSSLTVLARRAPSFE